MTENNPENNNSPNRKIAVVLVVLALVLAFTVHWSARNKTDTAGDTQSSGTVQHAAESGDSSAVAATEATEADELPEETASEDETQTGRLFFVGDSRTIDMFYDSDNPIDGEDHDGVMVYARHGHAYQYLEWLVQTVSVSGDDTLVTWMGANDHGNYAPYLALYDSLLAQGTRLVVCTVGPTDSETVKKLNNEPYTNKYMQQFNTGLMSWAAVNSVPVIDLYSYVSRNVKIDMADGVHYLPRPDPVLWGYILKKLDACGVRQASEGPDD